MLRSPIRITLTRELVAQGRDPHWLAAAANSPCGEMTRLRPGAYVRTGDLQNLYREQVHLARVSAAWMTGVLWAPNVLARESAAVVLGIPIVGDLPQEVQVVRPGGRGGRRTPGLRRLRAPQDYRSVDLDGVLCSSVAQTLADLARRRPLWSVLPGIDAMLRAGRVTKEDITSLAAPGSHGRTRLLRAVAAADPASESVGESLSRAVMLEEHLPAPLLQEDVYSDRGELIGRVDFMWPRHRVIGEFDGRVKYSGQLTGRNMDDLLLNERRREVDLERATGMRVVRWLWKDALNRAGLLNVLADVGIWPTY